MSCLGDYAINVAEGLEFTITVSADGESGQEIDHYYRGSIQHREGSSLLITLGDRFVGCRAGTDNFSEGGVYHRVIRGFCLTSLIVTVPQREGLRVHHQMLNRGNQVTSTEEWVPASTAP